MPRYRIELIDREGKAGSSRTTGQETSDFSGDIEAIRRALAMYRCRESSVIGYRVIDASSGKVVDQWTMPPASASPPIAEKRDSGRW